MLGSNRAQNQLDGLRIVIHDHVLAGGRLTLRDREAEGAAWPGSLSADTPPWQLHQFLANV